MIVTPRLILRPWRDPDLEPFAAQNADPEVMRYLNGTLTRVESDAYVARAEQHYAVVGYCKWAVEVAWRLQQRYWRQGYATEAAHAAIEDAFLRIGLTDIVAFTALINLASARVMEKLGMARSIEFDHPRVAADNPLRRHVLYRLTRA